MQSLSKRQYLGPLALLLVGIGLLAAGAALSITNSAGSSPGPSEVDPTAAIPRVSLEEAFAAYQDGTAVFVDVRSTSSFEQVNIPGSISIPLSEISTRTAEMNPDDWIITICA